jgi:hypothetical protein
MDPIIDDGVIMCLHVLVTAIVNKDAEHNLFSEGR